MARLAAFEAISLLVELELEVLSSLFLLLQLLCQKLDICLILAVRHLDLLGQLCLLSPPLAGRVPLFIGLLFE